MAGVLGRQEGINEYLSAMRVQVTLPAADQPVLSPASSLKDCCGF